MSLANQLFEHPWKSAQGKGHWSLELSWESALTQVEPIRVIAIDHQPWKWKNSAAPATPEFPNRVIFHLKLQSIMAEIWSLSFVNPVH